MADIAYKQFFHINKPLLSFSGAIADSPNFISIFFGWFRFRNKKLQLLMKIGAFKIFF